MLSCAAPPPPQATLRTLDATPASALYVTEFDATSETILKAAAAFSGSSVASIGRLDASQLNYKRGVKLDEGGNAFILPPASLVPEEVLPDLLFPLLIDLSSVACVQSGDQAYWAINQAAVEEIYQSAAAADPAVAQLLADCSQVAETLLGEVCPTCGCVGPMGGNPPRCPTTWLINRSQRPLLPTALPTPNP